MESKLLRIVVILGVPGVALGVFYLLLRGFGFDFAPISPVWSAVTAIVFILVVATVTAYALHLWRPNTPPKSSSQQSNDSIRSADEAKRESLSASYRLGFSLAKVAWHHGKDVQGRVLREQVTTFGAYLSLPKDILETTLADLPSATDPKSLLRNARFGIEARDAISSLIESRLGVKAAAAFRLGFGIVNVMPQLELMSTGQKAGLPCQELKGPLASQISNLSEDAAMLRLPEQSVVMLRKIDADPDKAEGARMLLMMVGGVIDKELNGAE